MPIHITSVRRAVTLLFLGAARGVDTNYQTFEWNSLFCMTPEAEEQFYYLRTLRGYMAIPRVIALTDYDKLPQRHVRFSRTHIFMRDQYTCQYCAQEFPKIQLNLDHVVPRSRGGKTSWDNVVTSCHHCNRTKANRTPQEARMPLKSKPKKPGGSLGLLNLKSIHDSWAPFLNLKEAIKI